MTGRLDGSICLVTGASGIAAAAARRFAIEGSSVFVVSLDPEEASAVVDEIVANGGRAAAAGADLRVESDVEKAFAACRDEFGPVDSVLAVAGGSGRRFGDGALHTLDLEAWEQTLSLNASTAMLTMREAVRHMQASGKTGAIAVVSSVLATDPSPGFFSTHAYAAAKGAINALVTASAAIYAADGIRINAIAPGVTATPMSARAQEDADIAAYVEEKQPLVNGFLDPEDVASAALFLLSEEARHITGQVIAVDGGWSVSGA